MIDSASAVAHASAWCERLQSAVQVRDSEAIGQLFAEGGTLRSLLAISWDFTSYVGREAVGEGLANAPQELRNIRVRSEADVRVEPMGEVTFISTFLSFENESGSGDAFVRLMPGADGQWQAVGIVAQLREIEGFPEQVGANRPRGRLHGPHGKARSEAASIDLEFRERDPQVVVIGAGHSGLVVAARLQALGVEALIVERNARVGDNWRNRYDALALHDRALQTTLPYLELPSTWPLFATKDDYADYLESYARLLKIAVWTSSSAENIRFDEDEHKWHLDVVRGDGQRRSLSPNHLVIATGANNKPLMPNVGGMDVFKGDVMHATNYPGADNWLGKKAVVVGAGTTGHDIAQELAERGVDVTLAQRTPTVIYNVETVQKLIYPSYDEVPTSHKWEDADLTMALTPFSELPAQGPALVAAARQFDYEILDGLQKSGFQTSDGPDGQGHVGLIFRYGKVGGYYYNIGASEMIVDGTIKVKQGSVERLTENTVVFEDGSELKADLVVFATGYESMEESSRPLLGDEIADRIGQFSRLGEDGEYRGIWRFSGQERLWFNLALGIFYSRFYSRMLALQIKAIEEGIIPAVPEQACATVS